MSWSKFVAPNSWGVPCFTVDFTVLFANLISECICKIKETEHFFSMLAPPAFSPNVSFFWPLCYFQKSKETTVGGSEILHRSVGSLSHYCDGLFYIPGGRAWDFWSIKSDRFPLNGLKPGCHGDSQTSGGAVGWCATTSIGPHFLTTPSLWKLRLRHLEKKTCLVVWEICWGWNILTQWCDVSGPMFD